MNGLSSSLAAVGVAFLAALLLTPAIRYLARRVGAVARPRADRWHTKPTAMLGGTAIFLAVVPACLGFGIPSRRAGVVVVASSLLWLLGLVDDLFRLKPYQKLIGQVMAAAVVVYGGLMLEWTILPPLNTALTLFWLVGITNAVNLLDNMDGLAAGVSAIAAGFLSTCCYGAGQEAEAALLAVFAAALVGFLVYNSYPASIFMGDCGSMFVGFFLAGAALLTTAGSRSRSSLLSLAVPLLILLLPIFDTTLVTVLRRLAGRAVSQGGRDHTSHRLVALGLSERKAVWLLYGFALISGFAALLVRELQLDVAIALVVTLGVVLSLAGVSLAGVRVYDERDPRAGKHRPLLTLLTDLSHRRRVFEVLLDATLIALSLYAARALVVGPLREPVDWQRFARLLALFLFVKLAAFLGFGVYRGLWRYAGLDSLWVFVRAGLCGSLVAAGAAALLLRPDEPGAAVWVLDALLLLVLMATTRLVSRGLSRRADRRGPGAGRRVLIYGAGDAGELLVREYLNHQTQDVVPVGFLDDDPLKTGRVLHGLRVLGGESQLMAICREHGVREVVISSSKIAPDRLRRIAAACREADILIQRMRLILEPLEDLSSL